MKKSKNYNVFALMDKDGNVYVGKTTMECSKRFKNGNGFTTCNALKNRLLNDGWSSFKTKVVAQNLPKEKAEMIEKAALSAVKSRMRSSTQNVRGYFAGKVETDALKAVGYTEWLGESFDGFAWGLAVEMQGWNAAETKGVVCDGQTYVKPNSNAKMKQTKKIVPMRTQTTAGVKLELSLDTRYLKKDGEYPVTIRLYKDGKYRHLQTGYSASPSSFPSFTPKEEEHLYKQFNTVCAELTNAAITRGSADIMAVGSRTRAAETLADVLEEKRGLMTNESTRVNYTSAINAVKAVHPDGLQCSRISPATIGKVLDRLRAKGYRDATINIYLSQIKSAINYGIYKGYVRAEQYPFRKSAYEMDKITLPKSDKRDDRYLTSDDMRAAWEYFDRTGDYWVGVFLFSYLHGGMNLADLMHLRFDDFYFTEGGFRYVREKTKEKNRFAVEVPSTEWTRRLLQRLNIEPRKGELVFQKISESNADAYHRKITVSSYINRSLRKMEVEINLQRKLSMTFARHTFCTVANKCGMPFNLIEYSMGHSNNGVSGHYIGRWTMDEARPYFMRLLG